MRNTIFYSIVALIFAAWIFILSRLVKHIDFGLILSALFFTVITLVLIAAIRGLIWRAQNGVNLFATLETNPEVLKRKLLLKMRQCNTPHDFPEVFNSILKESHNYPQWDIIGSRMLKSWYKYNVDYMLQYPMIFDLSILNDGQPYIKDYDPFYNIKADPWEETDWVNIKLEEI